MARPHSFISIPLCLLIIACGSLSSPSDTVKGWAGKLEQGNIEGSIQYYSSSATKSQEVAGLRALSAATRKTYLECEGKGFEIINETVIHESAEVVIQWKCGGKSIIALTRESSIWRIENITVAFQ
jgi:hypothetical protein